MSERFAFDKRLSLEKARIEAQLQKTNPGPQQNFAANYKRLNGFLNSTSG